MAGAQVDAIGQPCCNHGEGNAVDTNDQRRNWIWDRKPGDAVMLASGPGAAGELNEVDHSLVTMGHQRVKFDANGCVFRGKRRPRRGTRTNSQPKPALRDLLSRRGSSRKHANRAVPNVSDQGANADRCGARGQRADERETLHHRRATHHLPGEMVNNPNHPKAAILGGEGRITHARPRCCRRVELDIENHPDILTGVNRLSSAPPLEAPKHPIGKVSVQLVDTRRQERTLSVDVWYPAAVTNKPAAEYEVLPGVSFTSASAQDDPEPLVGQFPVLLLSHGRTGMRHAYSLLCEALAARGAIVVSPDHPGDALFDWAFGTNVDDRTNEINRLGDATFVLDQLASTESDLAPWSAAADLGSVAILGHSYGAYTGFAAAAGARGAEPDQRVKAVVGMQAYTRIISDSMLARVRVPYMLIVGEQDVTTPADTDADRVFPLTSSPVAWRVDIAGASHQASSDMGLYVQVADQIEGLPQLVIDYLASMAPDAIGGVLRPWRENLLLHVQATWAFLDTIFSSGSGAGLQALARLGETPGVTVRCATGLDA
jgi:predicted dienelactone hydrolase